MAASGPTLRISDEQVQQLLRRAQHVGMDVEPSWEEAAQYMRVRTDSMFKKLRQGGTHRGVTWRGFAPQYTRKDGTVVPAWGGIPKVRGTGDVKGRLRPSGQRLKPNDALIQDTKTLRGRAALVVRRDKDTLMLGPRGAQLKRYAAKQNAMRPFLFFEVPKDARAIGRIIMRYIERRLRGVW